VSTLKLHALTALVMLLALCLIGYAHAQPVVIPEASALYRHRVEQVVADVFGVNGSPARLAAQLHQDGAIHACNGAMDGRSLYARAGRI